RANFAVCFVVGSLSDFFDDNTVLFLSSSSIIALTMSFMVTFSRDVKRSARRSNVGRGNNAMVMTHRDISFNVMYSDSRSSNRAINLSIQFRNVPPV
ncbi:hypothetical protein BLA29_014338, partial [Euroglyphus maynei]